MGSGAKCVPLAEHHLCADDAKDCLEAWLGCLTLACGVGHHLGGILLTVVVTCDYDTFFTPLHFFFLRCQFLRAPNQSSCEKKKQLFTFICLSVLTPQQIRMMVEWFWLQCLPWAAV